MVMREKNTSIRELSEKTGIPKSAIQRYTSGDTEKIPIDRMKVMAETLGINPAYIMGWDDTVAPIKEAFGPNTPAAQKLRELGGQLDVPSLADPSERELVGIYRDLNALGQQTLLGTARGLSANPDMKKAGTSTDATA